VLPVRAPKHPDDDYLPSEPWGDGLRPGALSPLLGSS
jgi:hypothetical protein